MFMDIPHHPDSSSGRGARQKTGRAVCATTTTLPELHVKVRFQENFRGIGEKAVYNPCSPVATRQDGNSRRWRRRWPTWLAGKSKRHGWGHGVERRIHAPAGQETLEEDDGGCGESIDPSARRRYVLRAKGEPGCLRRCCGTDCLTTPACGTHCRVAPHFDAVLATGGRKRTDARPNVTQDRALNVSRQLRLHVRLRVARLRCALRVALRGPLGVKAITDTEGSGNADSWRTAFSWQTSRRATRRFSSPIGSPQQWVVFMLCKGVLGTRCPNCQPIQPEEAEEDPCQFPCVSCEKSATERALAAHANRVHGKINVFSGALRGAVCVACLTKFHRRQRAWQHVVRQTLVLCSNTRDSVADVGRTNCRNLGGGQE